MNVTITISKQKTVDDLARTTGYLGTRQAGSDGSSYDRLALTDSDASLVDRYWRESRERLCMALRRQIEHEEIRGDTYCIALTLSSAFDTSLSETIESGIANYFVQSMAAKWLSITDRPQSEEYASAASATLDYISRKCYCKRRPARPQY